MSLSTRPVLLRSEAILSVRDTVQKLIKSPNTYKLNNPKFIHSQNKTHPSTNLLALKWNPHPTTSFNHNLELTSTIMITHFNSSSFTQLHWLPTPETKTPKKNEVLEAVVKNQESKTENRSANEVKSRCLFGEKVRENFNSMKWWSDYNRSCRRERVIYLYID